MAITAETFRLLRSQQGELNSLIAKLDGRVQAAWYSIRADLDAASWGALSPSQRRNLARALDTQWGAKLETIAQNTKTAAQAAANAAWAHQKALAESQVPIRLQFNRPDPTAQYWMEIRTQDRIESKLRPLTQRSREILYDELRRGVATGANPNEIARRAVRRTANLGDTIAGGMARALNIARTEVLDAYRESAMLTELDNQDVLDGWVWVAKLGAHTCRSCWAKHGSVHQVDEPGPNDHPQGRCARVPKTKSWKELGIDGVEDDPTPNLDNARVFKRLTEEQQKMILGERGFAAWKEGRFPISKWSVEENPADWRPFWRAAKPPKVSPRPVVAPPKPSKPSGGTVRPPAPPKPEKATSWLEDHQAAKDQFMRAHPTEAGFGQVMTSSAGKLWERNGYYRGALDSHGELSDLYANNLGAVLDAGSVVEREWYARFQARMGRKPEAYLHDLRAESEAATKILKQIDEDATKGLDTIAQFKKAIETNKRDLATAIERGWSTATQADIRRQIANVEDRIKEYESRMATMESRRDAARKIVDRNRKEIDEQVQLKWDRLAEWQKANPNKPARQYWDLVNKIEGDTLKEVLSDLGLDMGHNMINWMPSVRAGTKGVTLVRRMEQAERLYPRKWIEKAARKNRKVVLDAESRGYNSGEGAKIVLSDYSNTPGIGAVNNVAIHELGHSMEYAIEGLAQMEWAYIYSRASIIERNAIGEWVRRMPRQTQIYKGSKEYGWEDQFKAHYTGKAYGGDAWELFTTGIESLWAGSGHLDREFRRWLLGVLTVL